MLGGCVIRELIGGGGMGRIYRAEQVALGREVAVKVLRSSLRNQPVIVQRFLAEARAASRLNHPHSVAVIDFGVSEDGIAYLVMEHLQGEDLFTHVQRDGVPPLERVCSIALAVLDVLAEAHALRIVHRDLKPENVLLVRRPNGSDTVKLLDFGVARIYGSHRATGTTPLEGNFVGTPAYAAPEQMSDGRVDGRADLYSLGLVMYELLTGLVPFGDDDFARLAARKLREVPPDPRLIAPHRAIPAALAEATLRAIAIRPADRFKDAEAMAAAVRAAARELGEPCAACGVSAGRDLRFCPHCGAVLAPRPSSGEHDAHDPQRAVRARATTCAALGWEQELRTILALRTDGGAALAAVAVVGEIGNAKAVLVDETLAQCRERGDEVHVAGPHPSLAPVPYWPIRMLLASLLGGRSTGAEPSTDATVLRSIALGDDGLHPLARAGIEEALAPRALPGIDPSSRAPAVAWALADAVGRAAARSPTGRVVIAVLDVHAADALSRATLASLTELRPETPALLLLSTDSEAVTSIPAVRVIRVAGGGKEVAATRWAEPASGIRPVSPDTARVSSPADAVLAAVDRLPTGARPVLQSLAILGVRASERALRAVAGTPSAATIESLTSSGLVELGDGEMAFVDPFIREVIVQSMAAGARRELHDRALAFHESEGDSTEIRAEHAFHGSDPLLAIAYLEKVGQLAAERGDYAGSALAFGRALGLARARTLEVDDPSEEKRVLRISRGLASALHRAGEVQAAWGVAQEALDRTAPADPARPDTLVVLGEAALDRARHADAARAFGAAIHLLAERGDESELAPRARIGLARAAQLRGDVLGAIREAREATRLLAGLGARDERRPALALFLAELLAASGDEDAASGVLQRAVAHARQAGVPALEAAAMAAAAQLAASRNAGTADADRSRAAALAAEAGDARGFVRWSTR